MDEVDTGIAKEGLRHREHHDVAEAGEEQERRPSRRLRLRAERSEGLDEARRGVARGRSPRRRGARRAPAAAGGRRRDERRHDHQDPRHAEGREAAPRPDQVRRAQDRSDAQRRPKGAVARAGVERLVVRVERLRCRSRPASDVVGGVQDGESAPTTTQSGGHRSRLGRDRPDHDHAEPEPSCNSPRQVSLLPRGRAPAAGELEGHREVEQRGRRQSGCSTPASPVRNSSPILMKRDPGRPSRSPWSTSGATWRRAGVGGTMIDVDPARRRGFRCLAPAAPRFTARGRCSRDRRTRYAVHLNDTKSSRRCCRRRRMSSGTVRHAENHPEETENEISPVRTWPSRSRFPVSGRLAVAQTPAPPPPTPPPPPPRLPTEAPMPPPPRRSRRRQSTATAAPPATIRHAPARPRRLRPPLSPMMTKFSATFYGFAEFDAI